jgi:uncharacterized protein (DUF2267 family)
MNYATTLAALLSSQTTLPTEVHEQVTRLVQQQAEPIIHAILAFLTQPISPTTTLDFENQLAEQLRELGRELMQWTVNRIEGDDPRVLPQQVDFAGERYRILAQKNISRSIRVSA